MKFTNSLFTVVAGLWLSASGFAVVDPGAIYIRDIDAAGTGCPAGSVSIDVSPDRQVFTAIFNKFQAVIDPFDPNVALADRHKRCDLSLKVQVPQGYQFSVFKADYQGWYDLQANMSLTQTSSYHFQGNANHIKRSSLSTGGTGRSGEFHFVDQLGVSSFEWSACGAPRNMYISAELRLSSNSNNSRGVAGIDAIEGQFKLLNRYGIQWRRCN